VRLGEDFTAINAAVGPFGLDTLKASTIALESSSPGDVTYTKLESLLAGLGKQRDAIAAAMKTQLYGGAWDGRPISIGKADALIKEADELLSSAAALA
jgi:hypothetical protein